MEQLITTVRICLLDSFGKDLGLERKPQEPDEEFRRRILDELAKEVTMSRHNIVDKSKESVVNYKSGDKVRIIGNSNFHSYSIGDIVTLESKEYDYLKGWYCWSTKERARGHYVRECDIEPYYQVGNALATFAKLEGEFVGYTDNPIFKQTKGDLNMSNTQRRVVNVILVDPDQGLPVEHSQVHDFGQIVTEDDDATTIQELIMTGDVQAKLDIHNKVRSEQTDLDILRRTGNEVKLQPVKLKNLKWIIK